ncbi:MAG: ankyrin repeat domain-containing protein [Candidatus Aminicenantes bacterium]|nr:ankyrin repeat domain-containing protein [Candidatus Aminicenantes bacterium]
MKKNICFALMAIVLSTIPGLCYDIHDAAQKGDLPSVRQLLEGNQELANQRDSVFGRTPLHWAARGVHLEVLRLLLGKGADPRAKDNSKITALHSVSFRGHQEATRLLLAKGAAVNAVDEFGKTPLAYAITGNHQGLVRFLVSKGGTVPLQGDGGRRLLHDAASQGDKALVAWMMEKGIDLSTQNGHGGTLLHSCCEGGLADALPRLIAQGLAVNQPDRYGYTALHYAARNGHKDAAEVLLQNNADINAMSLAGEGPVHLARRTGYRDLAKMLAARGNEPVPPRFPDLKGEYLGQERPWEKPMIFALGLVSSVDYEHSAPAFSPDGREVFWTSISDRMNIFRMRLENGRWTAPQRAAFSDFEDCYPHFSSDGRRLYYVTYRALKEGEKNAGIGINLWFVERTGNGWSEPRSVGSPFNTGNTFGFSLTEDGTVYYTDASAGLDIYRSRLVSGRYAEPEKLGEAVNSEDMEDEPFIAPDESYLIFKSMRPGGRGGADLYISFRKKDGSWTQARNLGPDINTEHGERFPAVSRDGRYFFFGSDRNGNRGDIYWMKADFIETLRPRYPGH